MSTPGESGCLSLWKEPGRLGGGPPIASAAARWGVCTAPDLPSADNGAYMYNGWLLRGCQGCE